MIFEIDTHSAKPIYRQVIDAVRYSLATGRLREGDSLPSIREVAVQTRINRNTIAKAYSAMEREGLIYTRVGQGSFISAEGPAHGRERSVRIIKEKMDELLALAHSFRMSREELEHMMAQRLSLTELVHDDDSAE